MKIKARTRRVIQSSDYSGQEPRVLAQLCGDEGMIQAYQDDKDLYAEVAAKSFYTTYEECLEHFPKDTPIKMIDDNHWRYATPEEIEAKDYDKLADGETDTYNEGKERRNQAKKILLGIMYDRGERSIAEQLGCSIEEAREIKASVYDAFPKIKVFERDSVAMVREKGYVTTIWGRKRRLPDFNLPTFDIFYIKPDGTKDDTRPMPESEREEHLIKLSNMYWKNRDRYIENHLKPIGVGAKDNSDKIANAKRQIINARVQGSSADMSKLSLIKIHNDEELNRRGVKSIIPVHDEIIIETPLRYAEYVAKRFSEDMETAPKPVLSIPIKCDVTTSERWYGKELDLDKALKGLKSV